MKKIGFECIRFSSKQHLVWKAPTVVEMGPALMKFKNVTTSKTVDLVLMRVLSFAVSEIKIQILFWYT